MAYQTAPTQTKTFKVTAGYTYSYIAVPAVDSRPTFLLLHGFPSTSYDWRHQVSGLRAAGYGVIAPDLLGYGGTDKPHDIDEYRQKKVASHVRDILDHEGLDKVIAVAHDWGVATLTWFVQQFAERCFGIVPIAVPYRMPGCFSNLDEANAKSEKVLGYPSFGYWKFFAESDAGSVFDSNPRAVFSLLYSEDPMLWLTDFCPVGAARRWIEGGKVLSPPSFCPQEEMEVWLSIWSSSGSFQHGLDWYRAGVFGNNDRDEAEVPDNAKKTALPTLFLAAEHDCVIPAKVWTATARASCENLRVETFNSGHWLQLEKPAEVNRLLLQFAGDIAG